jgi:hypothetical protein
MEILLTFGAGRPCPFSGILEVGLLVSGFFGSVLEIACLQVFTVETLLLSLVVDYL